jgi:ABC-type oligopeptide transport system substrate-binding subunit/DNA-binding SARP family transcriptional activator
LYIDFRLNMSSRLEFRLLGFFEILNNGRKLPKPATQKSQSLLAYLVLHRHAPPQTREVLSGLFWGDRPEVKARGSLSTALWHIHRCLPDDSLILAEGETVQFNPQADICLDVDEFTSHVSAADTTLLASGVKLYRGDLLDGFYDDWIVEERYHLQNLYCVTLERLMSAQEAAGRFNEALITAQRLLHCDPLREDAHRLILRADCHLGQRNAALTHYQTCRKTILAELGTEPMEETTDLYRAILDGRFQPTLAPVSPPVAPPPLTIPAVPARDPLDVTASSRMVGRESEMARLISHWKETSSGRGKLIFIGGEAGVGKTRLVDEFAESLRFQGTRVLSGRCYEFERALPYQPIVETLCSALPSLSASEQTLFPRWLAVGESQTESEKIGAGRETLNQDQTYLFDSVVTFLAGLSARGPILIVLEDLHWAAESTLQLLHYLARHLANHPVMLVGTYRSEEVGRGHPFLDFQQTLQKENLSASITLSRLSATAVEILILEMSGGGDSIPPLVQRLYQETEGNPFFLMETLKALFETGLIQMEAGEWKVDSSQISRGQLPLPESISETVLARVRTLDVNVQSALTMASILGREFDFELLDQAWGRGNEATLEALDHLLRSRLIEEGAGQSGRDYAFVHHKIQEAVYAYIPNKQCEHLHARAGTAMEKLYGARTENVVGEIAYHFEKCCGLGGEYGGKAVTYLLQAGDHARKLYAFQDAVEYYQRALAILKETHDYEMTARAQMKLGLAYHNSFDFAKAQEAYQESFAATRMAMTVKPGNLPPAPHALRVVVTPHPLDSKLNLDPLNFEDDYGEMIITEQLFARLVELTTELDLLPDIARDWQVLENGCKYIFHLRDDVFWSDGAPLIAADFELGLRRMVSAETGTLHNVNLLCDIKGVCDFHRGQADWQTVGFHSLDPTTLLIELDHPTAYFLNLLTFLAPVPSHKVDALGNSWARPDKIVTYGAFLLESWEAGKSLRLARNPAYRGRFPGNVQCVEMVAPCGGEDLLKMAEVDALDVLNLDGLATKDVSRQQHNAGYTLLPVVTTRCLIFDTHVPPFNDRRVRQAFVLALDREEVTKALWKDFYLPASGGLIPPGITGHSPYIALPFDPPRARDLLADSGYPEGRGFPVVEAWGWEWSAFMHECLAAQWQKNLGINIEWKVFNYREMNDKSKDIRLDLYSISFFPDYPDPDSLLRVNVQSTFGWGNPRYDELVEQARRSQDHAQRMQLYQQAEEILVEDAAVVPLFYHWFPSLVKPWVKNFTASPSGTWFWKYVILETH